MNLDNSLEEQKNKILNRAINKLLEVGHMKGLFIFIIIASVSISSCIFFAFSQSEITYEVAFDTSENTTFYVPVPIDNSNEIVDVMENLKVTDGKADWKLVDTIHGKALEVRTAGPCKLSARKKYGYKNSEKGDEWIQNSNISLLSELIIREDEWYERYTCWVYASNPNSTARICVLFVDGWNHLLRYSFVLTPSDPFAHVHLKEGWQTVKIEREMVFYD